MLQAGCELNHAQNLLRENGQPFNTWLKKEVPTLSERSARRYIKLWQEVGIPLLQGVGAANLAALPELKTTVGLLEQLGDEDRFVQERAVEIYGRHRVYV